MEAFEFLGVWWIPSDQTNVIPGTLTFTHQDGIRLTLMGSFSPLQDLQAFNKYPIILGVTQGGKQVTLSESFQLHSQLGFGGSFYANQTFGIGTVYIGTHFADPQAMRFHKIEAQYNYLPHWAKFPLQQDKVTLNEKGGLGRYEMTYTPPDDVVAATTKGTIAVTSRFSTKHDLLQEVSLQQSTWMEVETQQDLSLIEWLLQFVGPLQNLVSLGTCKPNFLLTLLGYTSTYSTTLPDGKVREHPVQIVYPQHYYETEISQKLREDDMLFTLQDIRDDFDQIVENWLKVAEDLDSVCNLFFGIQYVERLYLEQKFLSTIQSVESYHRRRSYKTDLTEDKHKERMKAILAASPQEFKKWLAEKLKYSNELSLRQRLKDLLDNSNINSVVLPLIGNKKTFIDTVVNTRNFLTHFDPASKKSAAADEELYRLTQVLSFLVQACFLHELGILPQRSLALFRRNAQYRYATNRKP
jgi:ApeA N-terminal domain 1